MALVASEWRLLVASIVVAACCACDTLHPPVIYNGVDGAIDIRASWSDGAESTGSIAPRQVSHLGRSDASLERVTVSRDGVALVELGEGEVSALRAKAKSGVVGISIGDDGTRDLTRDDLDRIRATR